MIAVLRHVDVVVLMVLVGVYFAILGNYIVGKPREICHPEGDVTGHGARQFRIWSLRLSRAS